MTRRTPPTRAAIIALAAASACVLVASRGEDAVLGWAARRAFTGRGYERLLGIAKLEELGDAGVPLLIKLSLDRTTVPMAPDAGRYAALMPRDTVGDLALDALRRIRHGPSSARAFEWNIESGVSFGHALERWRRAETDAAVEWWEAKRKASAAPQTPPGNDRPRGGQSGS